MLEPTKRSEPVETRAHEPDMPGRVTSLFALTMLVLAALNAPALVTASYDLPQNRITEPVVMLAEFWQSVTQHAGLNGPAEWAEEQMFDLRDKRLGGEEF